MDFTPEEMEAVQSCLEGIDRNVPVAVTNRKEKLLRFGSLTTASLHLQRAFVSFSGAGSLFPQR